MDTDPAAMTPDQRRQEIAQIDSAVASRPGLFQVVGKCLRRVK